MISKITKMSGSETERIIYEYNFQNRLSKVSVSTDELETWDSITEYKYDPDGNRVQKIVDGVITDYLVDSHNNTGYSQVFVGMTGANSTSYIIGDDARKLADTAGAYQSSNQSFDKDHTGVSRQAGKSVNCKTVNCQNLKLQKNYIALDRIIGYALFTKPKKHAFSKSGWEIGPL